MTTAEKRKQLFLAREAAREEVKLLPRASLIYVLDDEHVSMLRKGAVWQELIRRYPCGNCEVPPGRSCHCDPSHRGELVALAI
jgi:hypothetical protein